MRKRHIALVAITMALAINTGVAHEGPPKFSPWETRRDPQCTVLATWQDDGSAIAQCGDVYWQYDADGSRTGPPGWSPWRGFLVLRCAQEARNALVWDRVVRMVEFSGPVCTDEYGDVRHVE